MTALAEREGALCVESVSLVDVAARYGTPCFVYSRAALAAAYREFDEALQRTKLTEPEVRAYLQAHPEMRKATYLIPHDGTAAGTAAKTVLHVAKRMGRR